MGPDQKEVKVGEWILVEHGRWTRGVTVQEDGKEFVIRRVENISVMLRADEKPADIHIGVEIGSSSSSSIRPEDFM